MFTFILCLVWAFVCREFFKLGVLRGRMEGYLEACIEKEEYRVH